MAPDNFGVNAAKSQILLEKKNLSLQMMCMDSTLSKESNRFIDMVEELIDESVIVTNWWQFLPNPSLFTYLLSIFSAAFSEEKD